MGKTRDYIQYNITKCYNEKSAVKYVKENTSIGTIIEILLWNV